MTEETTFSTMIDLPTYSLVLTSFFRAGGFIPSSATLTVKNSKHDKDNNLIFLEGTIIEETVQ